MNKILKIIKNIKERRKRCPNCKGSGREYNTRPAPSGTLGNYSIDMCWTCGGTGERLDDPENYLV